MTRCRRPNVRKVTSTQIDPMVQLHRVLDRRAAAFAAGGGGGWARRVAATVQKSLQRTAWNLREGGREGGRVCECAREEVRVSVSE